MKTVTEEYYTTMYEGFDPKGKYHRIYFGACHATKDAADKALCKAMNDAEESGWTGLQGDIIYKTYTYVK